MPYVQIREIRCFYYFTTFGAKSKSRDRSQDDSRGLGNKDKPLIELHVLIQLVWRESCD